MRKSWVGTANQWPWLSVPLLEESNDFGKAKSIVTKNVTFWKEDTQQGPLSMAKLDAYGLRWGLCSQGCALDHSYLAFKIIITVRQSLTRWPQEDLKLGPPASASQLLTLQV